MEFKRVTGALENEISAQMSAAADRMRAMRARKRSKRKSIWIEYPDVLPLALADAEFIKEWDTENEREIRRAIWEVLVALCVKKGHGVTS